MWLLGALSDTTFMIVLVPVTIFEAIYEKIIEPWTKADKKEKKGKKGYEVPEEQNKDDDDDKGGFAAAQENDELLNKVQQQALERIPVARAQVPNTPSTVDPPAYDSSPIYGNIGLSMKNSMKESSTAGQDSFYQMDHLMPSPMPPMMNSEADTIR